MTYKITCKCGSEFYVSLCEETDQAIEFVRKEAEKFRQFHDCCDIKNELPEDWRV